MIIPIELKNNIPFKRQNYYKNYKKQHFYECLIPTHLNLSIQNNKRSPKL